MYQSGTWVGHWDQVGMGRQEMNDLEIEFDRYQLNGKGWDCVGNFTLTGKVSPDSAEVLITKKYIGRHTVVYRGQHDGEGMIHGAWALFGDHGTWAIRPAGGFHKSDAPIEELQP